MRNTIIIVSLPLVACTSETQLDDVEIDPGAVRPLAPPSDAQEDRFGVLLPPSPVADVLWIMEGSSSMQDELDVMRADFPAYMETIHRSNVDYRVGVLPMKINILMGELAVVGGHKWVDRATPNPTSVFTTMMDNATTGGSSGYHFDVLRACLRRPPGHCIRDGFRRDSAPLHTIVVTDERNRSMISIGQFVAFYNRQTDSPSERTFSAIIDLSEGEDFATASREIGGVVVDIANPDYQRVLAQFAETVAGSGSEDEFFLTRWPVQETITLAVVQDGLELALPLEEDWRYDVARNAVIVAAEGLPAGELEVVVRYDVRSGLP